MTLLYNTAIIIYHLLIRAAALFSAKARQFTAGRRNWRRELPGKTGNAKGYIWFHCASLGEFEQGRPLIETIRNRGMDVLHIPAMLCWSHGAFAWGKDAESAVMNAGVLEEVARMARYTRQINPFVQPAANALRDKHFYRKHGANAYYGQETKK